MKPHPGDCAAPLEVLEWLDIMDEKIETTSYGQVRRGQIPAALLRSTEPKDLSAMPPLTSVYRHRSDSSDTQTLGHG